MSFPDRYARQIALPGFGTAGQQALREASILVVGLGALGSAAAAALAAAGVGRLRLCDPDVVERHNLHRQLLYGETTLDLPKTEAAAARLGDLNPEVVLDLRRVAFTASTARELAAGMDVIVDGADNFPARFLASDTGFFLGKPVVQATILRHQGQITVFRPGVAGPCFRCLLPEPPPAGTVPSCAEAGVLGALAGILGHAQAMEAIKLAAGMGEPPVGRLVHFDALTTRWRELVVARDPACPLCGENPIITGLRDEEGACGVVAELDPEELRRMMDDPAWMGRVIDVRTATEHARGHIPGSRLVPLAELDAALPDLEAAGELAIYCQSGSRSAVAAQRLLAAGVARVRHLRGGYAAWRRIAP